MADPSMTKIALIVAADEPALFFASVRDAELSLEAIDVKNGVYSAAFGPKGEPYAISTDGKRVFIRKAGEPPQPEALKALILRFLYTDEDPSYESSLTSLLERCPPEPSPKRGGFGNLASAILALSLMALLAFLGWY